MPADPAMLEKLGLRDIPRWYREKYDVPSMLQPNYGNFHPQPAIVDQPAMRAIQYNAAADTSEPTGNGNNHHRGANNRFKSSRGVGFQGRARGGGWHKVGHRDNFPPTSAVDTTPESSASTSEEYLMANTFAARVGALNIDGGDPQEDGGVRLPDQHLLDKEGMSINPRLVAELLSLTDEVPMDHDMVKDLEKQAFRTKSRRLFDNSNDGSLKKSGENKTPATSPVDTNDVNTSTASPRGNAKLPRPAMADLLESSDPIISDQTLLFWGPIGEPVERRGSMNSNQSGSTVGSQFGWSPAN